MNAKFEKWCEDYALDVEPLTVESRRDDCKAAYKAGSKDAIQSLELTPQLCQIAEAAYDAEPATPLCDSPAMKEALQAFLSALKEQAK